MSNSKDSFLPKDYTPKMSDFMKLTEGDNDIRILSNPLIGQVWWESPEGEIRERGLGQKGDRPHKINYKADLPENVPASKTKEFWMLEVWDYSAEGIRILEVGQSSIIKAINEFVANDNWGDPRSYDINIKREGTGLETKYFVMPSPPKELEEYIGNLARDSKIDLSSFLDAEEQDPLEGIDLEEPKKEAKKKAKKKAKGDDGVEDDLPF